MLKCPYCAKTIKRKEFQLVKGLGCISVCCPFCGKTLLKIECPPELVNGVKKS